MLILKLLLLSRYFTGYYFMNHICMKRFAYTFFGHDTTTQNATKNLRNSIQKK